MIKSNSLIIGVDEVGLGSLAGPVVTAAVVLPKDKKFVGLRDSKKLKVSDREWLSEQIKEEALGWVIAGSNSDLIDRCGLNNCKWACMAFCVRRCLYHYPDTIVIVDGNQKIPGIPINIQKAVVKADDKYQAVSAASVIAKVYRDHLMVKLWDRYPNYNWKKNMGYGTAEHMAALRKYGVSKHHRKSYAPVKKQLVKDKGKCK